MPPFRHAQAQGSFAGSSPRTPVKDARRLWRGFARFEAFELQPIDRAEVLGVCCQQSQGVFQRCGGNQRIAQLQIVGSMREADSRAL